MPLVENLKYEGNAAVCVPGLARILVAMQGPILTINATLFTGSCQRWNVCWAGFRSDRPEVEMAWGFVADC